LSPYEPILFQVPPPSSDRNKSPDALANNPILQHTPLRAGHRYPEPDARIRPVISVIRSLVDPPLVPAKTTLAWLLLQERNMASVPTGPLETHAQLSAANAGVIASTIERMITMAACIAGRLRTYSALPIHLSLPHYETFHIHSLIHRGHFHFFCRLVALS